MSVESGQTDDALEAALEAQPQSIGVATRLHALTDRQANSLSTAARPTVVVLAGTVRSGKTTLLTSMYERFANGPIGQAYFSGSKTLPGFEARAMGLRPVEGTRPDMPHTHRNSVPWLHVRLRDHAIEKTQNLLLGDFDGELFDRIVDGKDSPELVPALRRADHLVIVVDGSSLISSIDRPLAVQRSKDLITRLAAPGVAASNQVFELALTKVDLVDASGPDIRRRARTDLTGIREYLCSRTNRTNVPVVETAAISKSPDLPIGHGVEELLDIWRRDPQEVSDRPVITQVRSPSFMYFGEFQA